jgi:hypothetical protein
MQFDVNTIRRFAGNIVRRGDKTPQRAFTFDRPLLLLQSDDWGRVGVRDQEGFEQIRAAGIQLGQHAYDSYTLETAEDVDLLHELLRRHRDCTGRSPSLVMNFITANLDFLAMASSNYRQIHLRPITEGLPGAWARPGLREAYQRGIADDVFYPALHGLTHFCRRAVENNLSGERGELLRTLWKAETPYIYWRMPWIGYEYNNPEKPQAGFLTREAQSEAIAIAAEIFQRFFSVRAESACAPGYRANVDTHAAWFEQGIRVAQEGSGSPLPAFMDDHEMLHVSRTIDLEPSQRDLVVDKYVQLAEDCFRRGIPAVISVHSINFHSTLKDFRTPTLAALDQLLTALESRHPNLLYVHDADLYQIATRGRFKSPRGPVSVTAKMEGPALSRARAATNK